MSAGCTMARISPGKARVNTVNLPSDQEIAIMRNTDARMMDTPRRTARGGKDSYAMSAEDAIGAASLMDRSELSSPLAGLPVAAGQADFKYADWIFGKDRADGLWDDYWLDDQEGYDYQNLAGSTVNVGGRVFVRPGSAVESGRGRDPAPISLVPTSTINPDRPRTVAAGYDEKRQVITVVFRDGTFYNYYDCDRPIWEAFKANQSKGRFIAAQLDYQPRGAANMGRSPVYAREALYRVARTGQLAYSPNAPTKKSPASGVPVEMQYDRSAPRTNPTISRSRTPAGMKKVPVRKSTRRK
jgi:hypothetical protein